MRFTALEEMVTFLGDEGVDLDFADTDKWVKPPEKLFEEYLKGEVRFGRHPLSSEVALEATRVRVLIQTPTEVLYEIYREYPSGKRVVQFDEQALCMDGLMARSGWSFSETASVGETLEETLARAFDQEFGLPMMPSNLPKELTPINDLYARATPRFRDRLDLHEIGKMPHRDSPRPSTVYPMWSIVSSHWFAWDIPARPNTDPVLVRNDEDVLIYRKWLPR